MGGMRDDPPVAGEAAKEHDQLVALGPLSRSVGYALRRAQVAVFGEFMAHIGSAGLRPGQFSVLLVVRETPDATALAQRELDAARAAGFDAVEIQFPYDLEIATLKTLLADS